MTKTNRWLSFARLEDRIALTACNGAFGQLVGDIANQSVDPAEIGVEVPDGPAQGDGTGGVVVGNIKSGTATGSSNIWSNVGDRIHDVRDYVVGQACSE